MEYEKLCLFDPAENYTSNEGKQQSAIRDRKHFNIWFRLRSIEPSIYARIPSDTAILKPRIGVISEKNLILTR